MSDHDNAAVFSDMDVADRCIATMQYDGALWTIGHCRGNGLIDWAQGIDLSVARGLCSALADALGVELHPAGTAAKLQELAKERDEAEPIGYSLRALLGLAWEYVHDARAGYSFLDAARAEGLLVGTYGGRKPTDLGRKTWTDFLRRLGLPGDGSKPEPEPEPTLTGFADGRREWRLNGAPHREDGPAIEWPDGRREWWLHGKRHREDGPAIEWPDGRREWWLHGKLQPEPDKGGRQ